MTSNQDVRPPTEPYPPSLQPRYVTHYYQSNHLSQPLNSSTVALEKEKDDQVALLLDEHPEYRKVDIQPYRLDPTVGDTWYCCTLQILAILLCLILVIFWVASIVASI